MNASDQNETLNDSEALNRILSILERTDSSSRARIIQTVQTFYGFVEPTLNSSKRAESRGADEAIGASPVARGFSEDRSIAPKEFMLEKRPQTDIEKVACLAYYLTHYLAIEDFKTLDISKLNTDAAQIKLSNAAASVENAARAGFLIGSAKGKKRLSALGELYVQALPDKAAAKEAIAHARPRRKAKVGKSATTKAGFRTSRRAD